MTPCLKKQHKLIEFGGFQISSTGIDWICNPLIVEFLIDRNALDSCTISTSRCKHLSIPHVFEDRNFNPLLSVKFTNKSSYFFWVGDRLNKHTNTIHNEMSLEINCGNNKFINPDLESVVIGLNDMENRD